ncbi:MAG: PepSY-like domain-containing protein [Bacteroidales bacterium]|nr:PepSY-like domain-containing protein [Bacteroidales bacterium]
MRKLLILLAAASICSAAYAGPVMDDDIAKAPKKVEKAFQKMYPGAKDIEWELKRDIYAADFKIDGKDVEAYFNAEGTWLRSKEDVSASSVPAAVKKAVKEAYPDFKIEDYDLVKDARGNEFYSVEIEKESKDGDTELTVRVLANGKILPNPGRGGRPGSGLKDGREMREFSGQRGARTESWKQAERAGGELEKK